MTRSTRMPRPSIPVATLSAVAATVSVALAQAAASAAVATTVARPASQATPTEAQSGGANAGVTSHPAPDALPEVSDAPTNVPAYAATESYPVRTIRGWTVRVSPALDASPGLRDAVLDLLDNQLYRITRVIPEPALGRLRSVEIWAETEMPKTACMCYHVSRGWLVPNGYNPDKEGTVEIGNAVAFLRWTKHQPWMVLHELAHAYHDQVFGYRHAGIESAWRRMVETGDYDEVGHIAGGTRRHYALTNPMEYFAETTEALYGTNDFHPFVRSELEAVDPEGFALVRSLWELDPLPDSPTPDARTVR